MAFKFNGGNGAIICDVCSIIFKEPADAGDHNRRGDFCDEHQSQRSVPPLDELVHMFRDGVNHWPRNSYVHFEGFESLYVRVTPRLIGNQRYERVLDIGNCTAHRPGDGAFTMLLIHLKDAHPDFGIYVENVLNKRFGLWLARHGFEYVGPHPDSPCYFLPPTAEEAICNTRYWDPVKREQVRCGKARFHWKGDT